MAPITKISVRNFGPFRDTTIQLDDRVNVIVGPNESGKSLLRDVVSLALTGTCAGHETGLELKKLRSIEDPDSPWQIGVNGVFAGEPVSFSRTDSEGAKSSKQSFVESHTRVSISRARACLYGSEILRLDPKARQALVQGLVPRETIEIPPEVQQLIKAVLKEDHREADLSQIEALHKKAYSERTILGRQVTDAGKPVPPTPPEGMEDLADAELGAVEETRAELANAIADRVQEREAALERATPKVVDLEPFRNAVETTKAKVDATEAEVKTLPSIGDLEKEVKRIGGKITEAEGENADIEKKRAALGVERTAAKNEVDRIAKTIGDLEKVGGQCCTCGTKLTTAKRDALRKELKGQHDEALAALTSIEEKIAETTDPLDLKTLRAELRETETKLLRRRTLGADVPNVLQAHETAIANLKAAEDRPSNEGDPKAKEEAEALAGRIAKGNARLIALVTYIANRKTYQSTAASLLETRRKHQAADDLVERLGPKGIRKALVGGGGLQQLHTALNTIMEPLGFQVNLQPVLDLEGDPIVTTPKGTFPLGRLSDSAQIRFGAAFGIAVAKHSKLGIVIVDRLEACTQDSYQAILGMLEASGLQVLVFAPQKNDAYPQTAAQLNAEGGAFAYLHMFPTPNGTVVERPTAATEAA